MIFFMAACDKCSFDYFQVIAEFYNDAKSLSFLRSHSVLPSEKVRAVFIIIIFLLCAVSCLSGSS